MNEKVVYLEFKNKNTTEEGFVTFTACINCKNKTFTMVADKADDFPMLKCAACGNSIGRVGWANDDAA